MVFALRVTAGVVVAIVFGVIVVVLFFLVVVIIAVIVVLLLHANSIKYIILISGQKRLLCYTHSNIYKRQKSSE